MTIAVFFDINKAFYSASHLGLQYKLGKLGIKGKVLHWITDFLEERKLKVTIGNVSSKFKNIL